MFAWLAAGAYLFLVTPAAAGRRDRTPPDTRITKAPAATTASTAVMMRFSSRDRRASFRCRLDGGRWRACTSPKPLRRVRTGSHTFSVRAIDRAGNIDRTPARAVWTVAPPSSSWDPAASASSATQPPLPTCSTSVASWCGGFETGDFSDWDGFNGTPHGPTGNSTGGNYFSLVGTPVIEGNRAFRAKVDSGATEGGQAGQRSLVLLWPNDDPRKGKTRSYQGSEQWYRSAVYFPPDFQAAPNTVWNWLIEWHNWPNHACCANLAFTVVTNGQDGGPSGGSRLSLRLLGGGSASTPIPNGFNAGDGSGAHNTQMRWVRGPEIARGHWYDILVHVKWSTGADGLVEWWLDGARMVSMPTPTLFYYADDNENDSISTPGPGQTYLMQGYYRPSGYSSEAVVYHDAARIGPTLASVS